MAGSLATGVGEGPFVWDRYLRAWLSDPEGRLIIALCFLAVAIVAVLLIAVPLITHPIRRTFRRLVQGVEEIRRRGEAENLPPDINGEAAGLVASLNHLLGEFRGRLAAMEEQRTELQRVLDAPKDCGIIATDPEGRIRLLSAGASQLLGWRPEELAGQSVEVLLREEDWNSIVPKLARRSLRETGLVQRVHLQRKGGGSFAASLSISSVVHADGTPGFVSLFRDLSEQAVLERRLQESEQRHRSLVEALREGVVMLQNDRIVYCNPAVTRILGRPLSEVMGRPFKEFIATEDLLLVLDRVGKVLVAGEPAEFELRLQRAGSSFPVEVQASFSRIENQGAPALMGTLRDETERRRFERDLTASRALLDATLDSTSDGILVIGARRGGRGPTLVNRRAEILLGHSGEEILNWTEERFHREIASLSGEQAEATGFPAPADPEASATRLLTLEGPERRLLELFLGPVRDADGRVTGRIYSFRDVTEQRRAEESLREKHEALLGSQKALEATVEELRAAQADLAARNDQLEKLNQELQSLDQMKSNLLANVSHELQTPLVSIKGYTEMILKRKIGPITPEQEKGLTVALRNIDRLVEMIDSLLDSSRIERGDTPLHLETFPLWQLIDEAIDLLREKIRRKSLYVTTQYETDDLSVKADRGKLSQVFINLLSNAIKFNREGGRITVRVMRGLKGFLDVEVQDTGIGIPPEEQGRIFERFYQVDSTPRKRYEGTGIGLAIVKEILALHGCSIRVDSRVGEGTTFAFNLPVGRSAGGTRPSVEGAGSSTDQSEKTRRG